MPKWLIDYDSTLVNTFERQIQELNLEYGTTYTEEDFTDWENLHIPDDHRSYLWSDDVFLNRDFQLSCEPLPNAIHKIGEIIDERREKAFVISDRPLALYTVTREWLNAHYLEDLPLIFTRSPYGGSMYKERAEHSKSRMAYYKRLTHVVEDAPHHALKLANRKWVENVYLLDKANNRHIEHPKITRVSGWRDIP